MIILIFSNDVAASITIIDVIIIIIIIIIIYADTFTTIITLTTYTYISVATTTTTNNTPTIIILALCLICNKHVPYKVVTLSTSNTQKLYLVKSQTFWTRDLLDITCFT